MSNRFLIMVVLLLIFNLEAFAKMKLPQITVGLKSNYSIWTLARTYYSCSVTSPDYKDQKYSDAHDITRFEAKENMALGLEMKYYFPKGNSFLRMTYSSSNFNFSANHGTGGLEVINLDFM